MTGLLRKHGYPVRHIAQEHSFVQDMWRKISRPDILIYLAVSYENTRVRRNLSWTESEYQEQLRRLEHARRNADLVIETDELTIAAVEAEALRFLAHYQA